MEVKAGYKRTEVGVIPEEWDVKPLKRLSPRQCVGVVINPSSYFDDEGAVPFLVGSNIAENTVNWIAARRISDESNQLLAASRLAAGDLVTVRVGEPGVTAVIPPELDGCNCASMMIVRQHPSFDSHWLCSVMNSRIGRIQVEQVQYGTAQKQFNISDAVDFCYPVPALPEQRTIAVALSGVDALIGVLDKLIAKKRDLKEAAMQQLLTGNQRLPGFTGEWMNVVLGNLLTMKATYGIVTAGDFKSTGVPMLRGGDIKGGRIGSDLPLVSAEKSAEYSRTILKRDDVVIALVGYPGEAARVPVDLDGANISRAVGLLRLNNKITPNYLVSYLNSPIGRRMVLAPSAGSAQLVVNLADLNKLQFQLPSVSEQTSIAEVLSDMDAELAALEKRRDKTRSIKQGMMQELLTGRTRLV